MRRLFSYLSTVLLVVFVTANAFAQIEPSPYTDSLKKALDTARYVPGKIQLLLAIAMCTMDRSRAAEYAGQAIDLAQLSRNQRLIANTYLQNGHRYMGNSALEDNIVQGMKNFEAAEQVAKENGLDDILVEAYCGIADVWHYRGNDITALSFCSQALAVAAGIDNDKAKVSAYQETGETYMYMNQMLLALRNFLNALDVSERNRNDTSLRKSYAYLRYFYRTIGEYDKAIDYGMKVCDEDRKMRDDDLSQDLIQIGDLFLKKGEPDLALKLYEQSINYADTIKFGLLKVNGYHRIFLLYLQTQEYKKGVQFLFAHQEMLNILKELGFEFYIDQLLASSYTQQDRYDSAYYYFRKAEPDVAAHSIQENQFDFYMDFTDYFRKTKNLSQSIVYANKAYSIAAATAALSQEERSTDTLEKLYVAAGNFPAALECNRRAIIERDSLRSQTQATDLMKLEVENDGRRRERLAQEERERTEHRHNIQYMGFTMGLVVLFVGLVMLGRLSVPVSVIRALVFVAFIFLFEFIIMLADKQIQGWTAEEPWKVLLLKILLAAGMVPLHHWLEHKVVHYLSHHKKTRVPGPETGGTTSASSPGVTTLAASTGLTGGEQGEVVSAGGRV